MGYCDLAGVAHFVLGRPDKHRSNASHLPPSTCLRAVRSRCPRCFARLKNRRARSRGASAFRRFSVCSICFVVICVNAGLLAAALTARGFPLWVGAELVRFRYRGRVVAVTSPVTRTTWEELAYTKRSGTWVVTTDRPHHMQHAFAGCVKIVSKDPEVRSQSRRIRSIAPPCDHA